MAHYVSAHFCIQSMATEFQKIIKTLSLTCLISSKKNNNNNNKKQDPVLILT